MNKTKILLLLLLAGCFSKEKDKLINARSKVETADIDKKNEHGYTELHLAVLNGEVLEIAKILDKGASLEIEDSEGRTALYLAVIERRGDIRERSNRVLLLLNKGANIVNEECRKMLFKIAEGSENIDLAVKLLQLSKRSVTINPLHVAAEQNREKILHLFLAKEIFDKKMDPRAGYFEKCKGEVEARSIVNEVDENGRTALHISAMNGGSTIIYYLLGHATSYLGENAVAKALTAKDKDGNTALHCAVINHQLVSVKHLATYMKKKSIPIDQSNNEGETALHLAVRNGNKELVELLLEAGADIDIGTSNHYREEPISSICLTPLHIAIITQQPEMVKFLSERGAKLDVKYAHVDHPHDLLSLSVFVLQVFKNYKISSEIETAISSEIAIAQALYNAEDLINRFLASELASETTLGSKLSDYWEKFKSSTRDLKYLEDDSNKFFFASLNIEGITSVRPEIEKIHLAITEAIRLIDAKAERLRELKAKRSREVIAEDTSGSSDAQLPPPPKRSRS